MPFRARGIGVQEVHARGPALAFEVDDLGLRAGRCGAAIGAEAAELVGLPEGAVAVIETATRDEQVALARCALGGQRKLSREAVSSLVGGRAVGRGSVGISVLEGRHAVARIA